MARSAADPVAAAEGEAVRLLEADQESCRRIGAAGLAELEGRSRVLTHCNAGRLATCGMGSALAPVYAKAAAGQAISVVATETRPLQQGARLTAWELAVAGIPVTLDARHRGGRGRSLRVASMRSSSAAIAWRRTAIPPTKSARMRSRCSRARTVCRSTSPGRCPRSTPATARGSEIVIEERSARTRYAASARSITAPDVPVWNPAFDVTPAEYIRAFITDAGVLRPPFGAAIAAALEGRLTLLGPRRALLVVELIRAFRHRPGGCVTGDDYTALVTRVSKSRSAPGRMPSLKSDPPEPRCTGNVKSWYYRSGLLRSAAASGRRCRGPESPYRARLSSRSTSATRSPPTTIVLFHSGAESVLDMTYFGSALSFEAIGSSGSVTRGQCALKIS